MKFFLLFLVAAILAGAGCGKQVIAAIPAVKEFDISRYCGKWYEIARLPNWFENGMTGVTAHYSLRPDGMVDVVNSGMKNGKTRSISGVARMVCDPEVGELEVSFQWPFWSSYRIIQLENDYTMAVVCGKSYDCLWILARNPEISLADLNKILEYLRQRGFETARLEFHPHKTIR